VKFNLKSSSFKFLISLLPVLLFQGIAIVSFFFEKRSFPRPENFRIVQHHRPSTDFSTGGGGAGFF